MNQPRRSGFSLMEVLLATGILLGSLIVLGQLATVGRKHAHDAETLTTAQLLCQSKLNEILKQSDIKSLTVVHMEVPFCSGLVHMAHQAVKASGRDIPVKEVTVGMNGEIKSG